MEMEHRVVLRKEKKSWPESSWRVFSKNFLQALTLSPYDSVAWLHSHRASGLSAHSGNDSQTVFRCPLRCLWLRTLPVLRPLKAFRFTRFVVESCHLLDDAGRRDHFFDRLLHLCFVYLSVSDFFCNSLFQDIINVCQSPVFDSVCCLVHSQTRKQNVDNMV